MIIKFDAPSPWGIYFQDSATPLPKCSGKSFNLGIKLLNSGDTLKLQVPSYNWKDICGWINHSCKVISLKISKNKMGNRGSKSAIVSSITVKEQRVDSNWCGKTHLRCTLMGFERNYPNKILTTQLINKRSYSATSYKLNKSISENNHNLIIDPNFFTGFADAEGSFVLSITKSNNVKSGWVIKPRFQIHLHKKDLFILEAIQNFIGVGKIYVQGEASVEYRVFSL